MPRSDRLQPEAVVDIRYGQVGLVQVRVHTTDTGAILDELTGRVAAAPHFFRRTGVCLDLSALEHSPGAGEVQAVVDALRRAGMLAVGLSGEADALTAVSAALGLPVLTTFRTPMRPVPIVQPAAPSAASSNAPSTAPSLAPATARGAAQSDAIAPAAAGTPASLSAAAAAASILGTADAVAAGITIAPPGAPAASDVMAQAPGAAVANTADAAATAATAATADPAWAVGQPALIHAQTVRSGQRVYGRGRDLIVTASVGPGAEVMADGCVHIYGPLRGRVMAGAHGQLGARVFCQQFYAELVSIAGVFRVFETIPPELIGMPVQAWLAGEELRFARIG